jgi:transcriptional regulator with XRE-family HTH domain
MEGNKQGNKSDQFISAKSFGERLKMLRIRRGYSVDQLATHVGVHRSTFAGYETQEKFPPIEKLSKVASILGTSTDYLIGLTDDPTPINTPKDVEQFLKETKGLHWNGIPLSEEQLKPLAELFNYVVKEKFLKEDKSGTEDK